MLYTIKTFTLFIGVSSQLCLAFNHVRKLTCIKVIDGAVFTTNIHFNL